LRGLLRVRGLRAELWSARQKYRPEQKNCYSTGRCVLAAR
jgi:hypothetical protein